MITIFTLIGQFLVHPYAVPLWGALSFLILQGVNVWRDKSKNKIEEKKVEVSGVLGDRQNDREDFQVIKETLYAEMGRMKTVQDETTKQLDEANEETKKCEERYFELATQYRELLKYCATLARKVRILEAKVTAHVSEEANDKTRVDPETQGDSE